MVELLEALKGRSEKIDRYRELKGSNELSFDKFTEEVRSQIQNIPTLDKNELMEALKTVVVELFNAQPDKTVKILDRIKESEDYIESLDKRQQAIIDGLDEAVSQLQSSINAIPDADLSGIEQSIKQIKPTKVTEIEKQVQSLSLAIGELKAIEPQKVDLQPLLDAINAPRTDTINLVTDNHGFPTKAIIERNGD